MPIKKLITDRFDLDNFIIFIKESFDDIEILDTRLRDDDLDSSDRADVSQYRYLADGFLVDDSEIGILLLEASSPNIENKRVGFAKVINKLAKPKIQDIVLVVIYHRDSDVWRLSFVSYDYKDAKQIANTDSKRYSFVLGRDIATTTAYIQLSTINKKSRLQDIKDAFSVERVTREFFNDYKRLYFEICQYLSPQKALFDEEKNIKFFTKKLLGRIVFLYFLQKKGWLGSRDSWGDGDKKFLSNIFDSYKRDDFYSQILQEIFFDALNTKRKDDYFPLLECKMPFLNGGLFAKDEFDKLDIIIEDDIFKKIFDTFNSYNFTIIEDNPNDSEVAIDPEMLGRVFEDLLEDRKDKGAFYTPREIVHYMCQQSLSNYLDSKDSDREKLAHLKNIKVLDPAIGSGAFPMGMLHEIVKLRQELGDKTNLGELKKEVIQNSIYGIDIEASAVEIAKLRFWLSIVVDEEKPTPLPNLFYKIMVGNSLLETINGFDPFEKSKDNLFDDNSTVEEIQKLLIRYFNESNSSKKAKLQNQIDKIIDTMFVQKIKEYQAQIDLKSSFLSTKINKEKENLIKDIENDMNNLGLFQDIITQKPTTELFFYKLYFAEVMNRGGFDVLIGNPPYVRHEKIKAIKERLKIEGYDSYNGTADLYIYFFEQGYRLLKDNGILSYITSNKYTRAKYGKEFREFVLANTKILEYIDFNGVKVFESATVDTSILSFQKSTKPNSNFLYCSIDEKYKKGENLETFVTQKGFDYPQSDLSVESFSFSSPKELAIKKRIEAIGTPLRDWDVNINYGIKTGFNEAFVIDTKTKDELIVKDAKSAEIIKPLLRGRDIQRYSYEFADKWLIFTYTGIIIDNYPIIKEYLNRYYHQLLNRKNVKNWYELQSSPNKDVIDLYENKKYIAWLELTNKSKFGIVENIYSLNSLTVINPKNINYKFLVSVLNSNVINFYFSTICISSGVGTNQWRKNKVELLPIPKISKEAQKPFEILVDYIMLLKTLDEPINEYVPNSHIINEFEEVLDAMVYELYFKEEFESKLIQFEKEKGYIKFIEYAKEDYASIEGLDEDKSIEIIHQSYQTLRKPYNKIRNNLILIDIEFSEFIKPIKGGF